MDDLLRAVESLLDVLLDGRLRGIVEDTGAAGLCWDVSHELVTRLGRGHLLYLDLSLWRARTYSRTRRYLGEAPWPSWAGVYFSVDGVVSDDDTIDDGHCVAVIDGYVVDLTAKQFGDHLPFPMVVPL